MQRVSQLRARLAVIEELREIVGAMRSLAAAQVQKARGALPGIREYAAVVGDAIAQAVALLPERDTVADGDLPAGRDLVVFCSEHGFVGAFNDRLVQSAIDALEELGGSLCIVGSKGALLAEERDYSPRMTRRMATHFGGIHDVVRGIGDGLFRRFARREIGRVDILFPRYEPGGRSAIEKQTLLPLDLRLFPVKADGEPPLHDIDAETLLDHLTEEYFFAALTHAATEAFASENGARLHAMEAAHDNIEKKIADLRQEERRVWQEEVTSELLDVVTGAEALLGDT